MFGECEWAKRNKYVLNGATMVPWVMSTSGQERPEQICIWFVLLWALCRVLLMSLVPLVL